MQPLLICIPAIIFTISPLWLKSARLARSQIYLLIPGILYAMVAFSPSSTLGSAPFHRFPKSTIAFFTCSSMISQYEFCERGEHSHSSLTEYFCICDNENALATLAHCYQTGYPEEIEAFIATCNKRYNGSLTRDKFERALQIYNTKSKDIEVDRSSQRKMAVDSPVRVSVSTIQLYKDAYDQFLGNYNRSIDYGWYMVFFLCGFLGLVAIGNWSKVLLPKIVKRSTGSICRWIRSNITLPALSGKKRTSEKHLLKVLDFLPPTRAESLILGTFCVLVLHCCFHRIHYVPNDPIFHNKVNAYMRFFAVRTGVIASSLLPLSVLFAGRNNVLQSITRWEYSTFVMLHRWISRIMVLLLVVHSIGYSRHLRLPLTHIKTYVLFGVLGTVSGLTILVQGLLVLRRKWYEAFLSIHIMLAAAFVVGAWFHVKDLKFLWYFYISACLWVFDRVVRIQKLCLFGFPQARVQLYADDTLKFRVPIPPGFKTQGGGHCFIHFLHWSCFWQSHPFTYTSLDGDIMFYVKVKKGITARLKEYLESYPSNFAQIRVAVEGSYGEATPATKYDSSVFIAGGNGIPGIYSEAINVVKTSQRLNKVKLVWVVRDYTTIFWFLDELSLLKHPNIETAIYVTRPQGTMAPFASDKVTLLANTYTNKNYHSMETTEDPAQKLKKDLNHLSFFEGRPDIKKLVAVATEESLGSTCFVTCGHPNMVDEVRHEVAQIVRKSRKRVDYFEQLQVWA